MPTDPRFHGGQPGPVFQIPNQQMALPILATVGGLVVQCCLLALVAWRVLALPTATAAPDNSPVEVAAPSVPSSREVELDTKIAVVDGIIARGGDTPDNLVSMLAERSSEVAKLKEDLQTHRHYKHQLENVVARADADLKSVERKRDQLASRVNELLDERKRLRELDVEQRQEIRTLKGETTATSWNWPWLALAAVAGAICGGGLVAVVARKPESFGGNAEPLAENA